MTRQRAAESLASTQFARSSPHCHGKGVLESDDDERRASARPTFSLRHQDTVHEIKVIVHPDLLNRLRTEDEEHLVDIERRYTGSAHLSASRSLFTSGALYRYECQSSGGGSKYKVRDGRGKRYPREWVKSYRCRSDVRRPSEAAPRSPDDAQPLRSKTRGSNEL